MVYSEDFKKRVKELYPNYTSLHEALDEGSKMVGMLLGTPFKHMPISKILEATSLEELQEEARILQKKVDLYHEWNSMYQAETYD